MALLFLVQEAATHTLPLTSAVYVEQRVPYYFLYRRLPHTRWHSLRPYTRRLPDTEDDEEGLEKAGQDYKSSNPNTEVREQCEHQCKPQRENWREMFDEFDGKSIGKTTQKHRPKSEPFV